MNNQVQVQKTKKIVKNSKNNETKNWVAEFRLPLYLAPEILDMTAHAVISDVTEGLGYLPLHIVGDEFTSLNRNIKIFLEGVGNEMPYAFKKLKEVYGDYFIIL